MLFGGRALSSLRLEKNYGSFNKDFRPDYTPGETGLDRFVDFDKPDFVGRTAALAERAAGPGRRFVVLEVAARDADVVSYERRLFDSLFATDDQKEGMDAFVNKRKPVFKHQ